MTALSALFADQQKTKNTTPCMEPPLPVSYMYSYGYRNNKRHYLICLLQAKTYALKDIYDRPVEFASKYFIEARGTHSETYNIIVYIMTVMAFLPPPTFATFAILSYFFVYGWILNLAEKLIDPTKIAYMIATFLTSVVLHLVLVGVHIVSLILNIEYGYKVLHYEADSEHNIHKIGDIQPFFHAGISSFLAFLIFAVALPYAVYRGKKDWSWKVPLAISLSVNFIYIGFNFLPYMLMAFINDPLQTFFIYILILFVGACAFMFILRSVKAIAKCCCNRNEGNSSHDCRHTFCFLSMEISLALSAILSIIAIAYILTLGSFHDFQGLKSVLLPIMVAIFVMALLKPGYKRIMVIFSTGESFLLAFTSLSFGTGTVSIGTGTVSIGTGTVVATVILAAVGDAGTAEGSYYIIGFTRRMTKSREYRNGSSTSKDNVSDYITGKIRLEKLQLIRGECILLLLLLLLMLYNATYNYNYTCVGGYR